MEGNNSDDGHLAIEECVDVNLAKVESDFLSARDKIDPSLVNILGVDVDFVNLNIISESALLDLQIEGLVVHEVRG